MYPILCLHFMLHPSSSVLQVEMSWCVMLCNRICTPIKASASRQHLYSLTCRKLWPICTGETWGDNWQVCSKSLQSQMSCSNICRLGCFFLVRQILDQEVCVCVSSIFKHPAMSSCAKIQECLPAFRIEVWHPVMGYLISRPCLLKTVVRKNAQTWRMCRQGTLNSFLEALVVRSNKILTLPFYARSRYINRRSILRVNFCYTKYHTSPSRRTCCTNQYCRFAFWHSHCAMHDVSLTMWITQLSAATSHEPWCGPSEVRIKS